MTSIAYYFISHRASNSSSFITDRNAWCVSGAYEAGYRCESIIRRLRYSDNDDTLNVPSKTIESTTTKTLRFEACEPNTVSYHTALTCLAQTGGAVSVERAEGLLRNMETRMATGETLFRSDVTAYNIVMAGWLKSKHKNSLRRIKNIIRRMENHSSTKTHLPFPNTISYNILISCLATTRNREAFDEAMEILRSMKGRRDKEEINDTQPDVFTYTSIISGQVSMGLRWQKVSSLSSNRNSSGLVEHL